MKIDEKYESREAQNRETVVPRGPTTKNAICNVILLWYKMVSFERDIAKHGVKVSKMEGTGLEGAHQ